MNRRYQFFREEKDKEFWISLMKKYFKTKQELDKFLEKLITPYIQSKKLRILDACCGIGHLCHFLNQISPNSFFVGVDQTPYLIDEAKKLFSGNKNLSFEVADVYNLPKKYHKFFDITINWKTLSWLPYYDEILKSLFSVTKSHIFISSLFYDENIDFEIKVREYEKESGKDDFNLYYNIYSYPKFENYAYELGAKSVVPFNFEINIDIPKTKKNHMETYTINLENGKKLQVSGALMMPWKVIRIDL